jgi:hypothetical protein
VSRADKRLAAMRRNPAGDWRIEDVKAVCRSCGIACAAPTRGSHYDLSHPMRSEILTVPFARPIKAAYIRKLVAFIDAIGADNVRA